MHELQRRCPLAHCLTGGTQKWSHTGHVRMVSIAEIRSGEGIAARADLGDCGDEEALLFPEEEAGDGGRRGPGRAILVDLELEPGGRRDLSLGAWAWLLPAALALRTLCLRLTI